MFAPQSHSGFYHCPLSKCFLALVALSSCVLSLTFETARPLFFYDIRAIIEKCQIWRLFTVKLAFLDTKDLICGALIMYYFRIFERRFGPRRFLGCLLVTGILSSILELTIASFGLYFLGLESLEILPSGPHGFIFPFFVAFFRDIPRVAFTHLLGVPVTGKSFVYIIGLQMAVASVEALVVCLSGLLAGYIFHSCQCYFLHKLQPPKSLMEYVIKPLISKLDSPAPADLSQPMGATLELQAQDQMDRLEAQLLVHRNAANLGDSAAATTMAALIRTTNSNVVNSEDVPVLEDQVQKLIEMGFARDGSTAALRASGNDLNVAMNLLLQEGGYS